MWLALNVGIRDRAYACSEGQEQKPLTVKQSVCESFQLCHGTVPVLQTEVIALPA